MDIQRNLLRERKSLLEQWKHAPERERAHLLVRIMDIDEQLEPAKKPGKEKVRLHARFPKRYVV